MPQTQGAGTVSVGGPGTAMRGPILIRSGQGANAAYTLNQLCDANGLVATNALDPTTIQYKKVVLTSAQIKALKATAVSLVAAPGAGKFVNVLDAMAFLNYGTAGYAAGGVVAIQHGSVNVATLTAALINGTAAVVLAPAFPNMATAASLGAVNQAVTIVNTGAGEFTTGDSTITIHIWYQILTAA